MRRNADNDNEVKKKKKQRNDEGRKRKLGERGVRKVTGDGDTTMMMTKTTKVK